MTPEDDGALDAAALMVTLQRWREAFELLRRADPVDPRTYLLRGQALLSLGRFADAERELRHGLDLDPEHVMLLMWLAQAQMQSSPGEAEVTLRKALALEPDNPALLSTYVFILMEQGRYEWAERMLERGMKIAPEAMAATRTMFLLRATSSGDALGAAQQMLGEMPDEAFAHYLQGLALLRARRPSEAMRHLREAAALRPADPAFAETARTLGAWYLWPVHLTSGGVHMMIGAPLLVAGFAAMMLADGEFGFFWKIYGPFLAFTAYKWLAVAVSTQLLKRRVARAMGE